MPEMDGLEFIRRVRESHAQMHFIILSGHDNFEFARQAMRYGVSDFLLKPIDPAQFQATLERACGELDERKSDSPDRRNGRLHSDAIKPGLLTCSGLPRSGRPWNKPVRSSPF